MSSFNSFSPHTFEFLEDLSRNNNREWFNANKAKYLVAQQEAVRFAEQLLGRMHVIAPYTQSITEGKKCVFRIYRDTRFSKDKTPYKTHFGIGIGEEGGGFYVHISAEEAFLGGGYWNPSPEHLQAIRQEIDYHEREFISIVEQKDFIDLFGKLDTSVSLKKAPKGYEEHNPLIHYLKLKQFIVSRRLSTQEILSPELLDICVHYFTVLQPLNHFLRRAISDLS